MAGVSISLLGQLQVKLNGQPITGLESVKSRALLAYLADDPEQCHTRITLAGFLWTDSSEIKALGSLRQVLFHLRKVVSDSETSSPFLLVDRESVAINPHSDYSIDTLDFRTRLNASPSQAHLEQAVLLYQGEFLEEFPLGDSPFFDEWVRARREQYHSQFLEALCELAKIYLSQAEYRQAEYYAHRQIEIEPWREEAHCQLMEALALQGRRGEALAQYRVCGSVLKKEINVEPGLKIVQLFERIRGGDLDPQQVTLTSPASLNPQQTPLVGSPALRADNLPSSLTSFIGRDEELAKLAQLVAGHRLVTLTGPGGVGKSRLALELAHQLWTEFRDGIGLVDMGLVGEPAQAHAAMYNTLGLDGVSAQLTMKELVNHLHNRQILLVLDNCGHSLKTCTELAHALLQSCPGVKILATSRVKSGLAGEAVFHLSPLAFPDAHLLLPPESILDYAAVRLFVERARAALPTLQVTEHNLRFVVDICKRLDGIPLAIEQAASHLDLLSLEQLASHLKGSLQLLTGDNPLALPRQQSYGETIEWSCQVLPEKEHLLLQRLSVFEDGFTLDAVEKVCAGEGLDRGEVAPVLSDLMKNSLVMAGEPSGGETRLCCLHVVQQHAQDRLHQTGEGKRLDTAHCAYFTRLAEAARHHLMNGDHLDWIRRLDADRENLFRAIHWAIGEGNDPPSGLQILVRLERWWKLRGYFERGVKYLRQGLSPCSNLPVEKIPLYTEALCLLAKLETNRYVAIALLQQAFKLACGLCSDNGQELGLSMYTAGFLSRVWDHQGLADISYLDQTIAILKKHISERAWEMGVLLDEKSLAFLLLNDFQKAGSLARESWEIIQESGDGWFSNPLTVMGKVAIQQRDFRQARSFLEDVYARRLGEDDAWGVDDLESLAFLERAQGHYREAVARLREAINRSRQRLSYYHFVNLIQELAFTEIEYSREKNTFKAERRLLHAARLLGAAETGQSIDSLRILAFPKKNYDPMVAELRTRLDSPRLTQAWKEGNAMWIDQSAAYALGYPLGDSK